MNKATTEVVTKDFMVMGGKFRIVALSLTENDVDNVIASLMDLENKWSRFLDSSEISKLNNAEGEAVSVSQETLLLIKAMQRAVRITKGYFDPTTLPILVNSGYAMSRKNIQNATNLPSSAKWPGDLTGIKIDGNLIKLPIGTTLDPGGIGKGLAADIAVNHLMQLGASGALVNANGDVVVKGESPQGGPWVIAIENPIDENLEFEQIRIISGAVATSSRVHQKWEQDGKQVHHLVNPHTGSTAITPVLSATVVCGNGADAEALAKVPFILEINSALNFIEQAGAECLIIDESLVAHKTKGWDKFK